MGKFFVSYKSEDEAAAKDIVRQLNDYGVDTWWSAEDLQPADKWADEIDLAIKQSTGLILIVSSKSLNSIWVTFEWTSAYVLGKTIFPIAIEKTDEREWHPRLRENQAVSTPQTGAEWVKLVKTLQAVQPEPDVPQQVANAAYDLHNSSQTVQKDAINTLREHRHPSAIEVLARAAMNERSEYSNDTQISASFALAEKSKDERVIPGLQVALQSPDEDVVEIAIERLGMIGTDEAVEILGKVLLEEGGGLVIAAARALGQSRNPRAKSYLVKYMSENSGIIAGIAANAVVELGDDDSIQSVIDYLSAHHDQDFRRDMAEALGLTKSDSAKYHDVLVALGNVLFNDKESLGVRRAAAQSIREIGGDMAQDILKEAEHQGISKEILNPRVKPA